MLPFTQNISWMFGTIHHSPTPPYSPRNFENWACMPLYIGWCFLDLKWTFYRALLPIYIKNDSGVFVAHLARATILTHSCQVFVLQLYLCNNSVLTILYYDHCPVAMYLICSDCFVVISTNEILDMQMSHRQLLWFVTYFNCNEGLLQQQM